MKKISDGLIFVCFGLILIIVVGITYFQQEQYCIETIEYYKSKTISANLSNEDVMHEINTIALEQAEHIAKRKTDKVVDWFEDLNNYYSKHNSYVTVSQSGSKVTIISNKEMIVMEGGAKHWISCNSNSMGNVIDCRYRVIGVKPVSEGDIGIGDIISFYSHDLNINVIHRVRKKYTENGIIYFETAGDNNWDIETCIKNGSDDCTDYDSGRIQFYDIHYKVVGVVW